MVIEDESDKQRIIHKILTMDLRSSKPFEIKPILNEADRLLQ